MTKHTKIIVTVVCLAALLLIDFLTFNLKLNFGPIKDSDGYALNNDPLNLLIRIIASILCVFLLWYLLRTITSSNKKAILLTIALIPILLVTSVFLSVGIFDLW